MLINQPMDTDLGNMGEKVPLNTESTSRLSEQIWNRYFERLLRFATSQMRGMPKVASDEEDITLSVLKSVCLSLRDRKDAVSMAENSGIWNLLVLICKRKIANQYAYQNRHKRAASRSQSLFNHPDLLEELQSTELQPQRLIEWKEILEQLFGELEKDLLKQIALAKIQGCTNPEIASRVGCSLSTVERKLRTIREIWQRAWQQD